MASINRQDEHAPLLDTGTKSKDNVPIHRGDIMTGATCGAGDAHSSGTLDLTFGFCEGYGARHTFTIMSFIGYFNLYALRFNLSVTMVAMANHTDIRTNPNETSEGQCPDLNGTKSSTEQAVEFDWDEATQGLVLSSFFYGYVVTQIPGGLLSEKFGGKHLFGYGVLVTAILSLLTPLLARVGTWALILARVIEGLAEGMTFPAACTMQSRWTPEMERTTLPVIANSGATFGNVVVLPIAGYLCSSGVLGGWPSVFYIFGGIACVWFLFWHFMIYETPADHPRITLEERTYIESTAGVKTSRRFPTPWRAILTSIPMWAIIVTFFLQAWGGYITLTTLPTYMNKIQKFDITQDGLLMALPNLLTMMTSIGGSCMADFLRRRRYMSTVNVRKLFNTLGLLPAALCLPFITLAGCEHAFVTTLIVVGNGMTGFVVAGVVVNLFDIGYNFAGILMGIANFSSNLPGIISPYFVGLLTNNDETMSQWRTIFYVSMGTYIAGTVIFLLFAKGTEQPWNRPPKENSETIITSQTIPVKNC